MGSTADSAGLLVFRRGANGPEFLLVHPGGPFWWGKDAQAWSFPKGRIEQGETPLSAARREFEEETGLAVSADVSALTPIRRRGRGRVFCWLVEADLDLSCARSNVFHFKGERPGSTSFPEVDTYAYCDRPTSLLRIHESLRPILVEALERLDAMH